MRRTTKKPHISAIVQKFLPDRPHCKNARRNRSQEDLNSLLEETIRTLLYYVDDYYPARPVLESNNLSLNEAIDVAVENRRL